MTERTCRTYAEFWLYYLREHGRPQTRAIHYAGTALVIAFAVLLFVTGNGWWALAMPFTGYGFAWAAISSSSATARDFHLSALVALLRLPDALPGDRRKAWASSGRSWSRNQPLAGTRGGG